MAEWISVKDRLPQPYANVLAYRKNYSNCVSFMTIEHIYIGLYETLMWSNDCASWKSVVTHWMPLPEPPKEGK